MKLLQRRNQKEVEEKRKIKRLISFHKYKKWIGLLVYPFFMLFTFLTANGQHKALQPLLNLEFDKVRQVTTLSNTALDLYYANLADVIELILLENTDRFNDLKDNQEKRLAALKNTTSTKAQIGFVQAEIKLQWAFVNFKYGNEWNAFWGLRSAYNAAKENISNFPDFKANERTIGLLNIIFGNVPEKNKWLMNLFGLKGEIFTGISQLEELMESTSEFKDEAQLVLSMVNVYLLEDFDTALDLVSDEKFEINPLNDYVKSLVYLKAHHSIKARYTLQRSSRKLPIHDYFIAETFFQSGEYEIAINHYQKFIGSYKGVSYVKDAFLKISMAYGFLGDTASSKEFIMISKTRGSENSEVDKNAAKILNSLDLQNPIALRIRFAIDGGFYNTADSLINIIHQQTELSKYDQLELVYRKARLQHIKGNMAEAMGYYHEVIKNAELISETYYAPNSFLQMGYLMRNQGDIERAKMYFNQVLSFQKHPYKSSIDSKANIALKRLALGGD